MTSVFRLLERWDNLPSAIQATGIALLTIFIPLAIATLQDIYQRKGRDDNAEFFNLDRNVVLDKVFGIKRILSYAAIIFLPTLLWGISHGKLRLFEFALSCIGIYLMVRSLLGVYRWIKGDVFEFRFNYLRELKSHNDLKRVWRSVWETKSINPQDEMEFFQIFSTTLDKYLNDNKENLKTASKLLNDFENFTDNRSAIFLIVRKEVFPKILEWHFQIWHKEMSYLGQNEKLDEWSVYEEIFRILDSVILRIEQRSLEGREIVSLPFFKYLKNHINSHKTDYVVVENDKRYYILDLLATFYRVFFESITDSPSRRSIWLHYFPQEWKITKNNLEKNTLAWISWDNFQSWALGRISELKQKEDKKLDDVLANLFSEVNPDMWANILLFVYPPDIENRIRTVIEQPMYFSSLISRCNGSRGYSRLPEESDHEFFSRTRVIKQEQEKKEIRNTAELTCLLFKDQFSKENLKKYVEELGKLEYSKDSMEERKRMSLLNIFSGMLEFLNQQTKPVKEQP